MSTAAPAALRVRRPRWRDPRLSIGVLLVLVSVIAGALLAGRLAETTAVLAARENLVPGDVLTSADLVAVDVRLGDTAALYVGSVDDLPEGAIVRSPLRAGELLAVSVVGQPEDIDLRPVVLPVDSAVAESVVPGARVELWRTRIDGEGAAAQQESATAALLHRDAVVRSVDAESGLGLTRGTVEVLVPSDAVGPILEALAEEERIDVISVPGAASTAGAMSTAGAERAVGAVAGPTGAAR